MKTVNEIKEFIIKNQGKTIGYGKFSIQVYNNTSLQAAIFMNNKVILKIEDRSVDRSSLNFYMTNEEREHIINYTPEAMLKIEDAVIKIYDTFYEHKNIENVLIALLQLHEVE